MVRTELSLCFAYHIDSNKRPGVLRFMSPKNDILETNMWANTQNFNGAIFAVIWPSFFPLIR